MGLLEQLTLKDGARVWAIVQCVGKNHWLDRVIRDFKKQQKPVVLANLNRQKLPPSGTIIIGKNIPVVVQEIQEALSGAPVVRIGKRIRNGHLEGFSLKELHKITQQVPDVHFLIELPCDPDENFWLKKSAIHQWVGQNYWDQLLIAAPMDGFLERLTPPADSDTLHWEFFTDKDQGLQLLFGQNWPAGVVLSGAENTRDENQVMLLVRELIQQFPDVRVGVFKSTNNTIQWAG